MMNNKEFKNVFDQVAQVNGFEKAYGGWFKKSEECIAVLELQKSSYGDYYYLNIKIFIQGLFDKTYIPNKDLIKSSMGDINSREPKEYKDVLDFDELQNDNIRRQRLEELFQNYIIPFVNKVMTRHDIIDMHLNHGLFLFPATKEELGINEK